MGPALLDEMEKYNHQVGLKIVGECLPQEHNRVTLTDERTNSVFRIPRMTYSFCDNDKALIKHALGFMRRVARKPSTPPRSGTRRTIPAISTAPRGWATTATPASSTAIAAPGTFRILWICDGSVFPTVGGVNPSLTIQAIACRTADRIRALAARGEL